MTYTDDIRWMKRALRLAAKGRGRTSPNPMVGAVLVKNDRVVGEGYHHQVGGPHAEEWALRAAEGESAGATLYINLEPCAHYSHTPPCSEALIAARLRRVVAARLDPDPRVQGRGAAQLRAAGIEVTLGVLEQEASNLNEAYLKHKSTGFPFVALKSAMSLDGKIATAAGESQWITSERARAYGHRLRSWHDAVMVGVETVRADDPALTVRMARGRNPLRVVVDSQARTPLEARILIASSASTLIAVTKNAPQEQVQCLEQAGAEIWSLPSEDGRVVLRALMKRLGERNVQSVLIEGGGTLAEAALAAGLVDRVYFFLAPIILGGAGALTAVEGKGVARLSEAWKLQFTKIRRMGEDILITADMVR